MKIFTDLISRYDKRIKLYYGENYALNYRFSDNEIKNNKHYFSLKNFIIKYFDLISNNKKIDVLDIGCGTGRYFHLFDGKKINRFVGIDISNSMLKIAKENPPFREEITIRDIELIQGDFLKIKNIGKFDFVYSIGVLGEHTFFNKNVVDYITENYLKQDSIFLFTVVCWWHRSYKRRIINNVLKILGLEKFGKNFYNYDYEVINFFLKNKIKFEILELNFWNEDYPHYLVAVKKLGEKNET